MNTLTLELKFAISSSIKTTSSAQVPIFLYNNYYIVWHTQSCKQWNCSFCEHNQSTRYPPLIYVDIRKLYSSLDCFNLPAARVCCWRQNLRTYRRWCEDDCYFHWLGHSVPYFLSTNDNCDFNLHSDWIIVSWSVCWLVAILLDASYKGNDMNRLSHW